LFSVAKPAEFSKAQGLKKITHLVSSIFIQSFDRIGIKDFLSRLDDNLTLSTYSPSFLAFLAYLLALASKTIFIFDAKFTRFSKAQGLKKITHLVSSIFIQSFDRIGIKDFLSRLDDNLTLSTYSPSFLAFLAYLLALASEPFF
jgi:hypothetical protein